MLLTYEQRIVWYVLAAGKYVPLQPNEDGVLRSRAFPGLWLDPIRFWNGDINGLLTVLGQGLASVEHAEFMTRLQAS